MDKPISFYFHCNMDPYCREAPMTLFNEFCILSNIIHAGYPRELDYRIRIYSNKPTQFQFFKDLNNLVEFELISKEDWQAGLTALKDAKPTYKISHLSDFYRYFYLVRHGGIYMDTDVIVTRPYKDLVNSDYDLILSREKMRVSGGSIISKKADSGNMKAVLQNYFDDYRPDAWTYNAMEYLTFILEDNPGAEKIKILQREEGFYNPHCVDTDLLYKPVKEAEELFKNSYAHHICGFLTTLPKSRKMRKRIQDLISGEKKADRSIYLDNLVMKYLDIYYQNAEKE